MTALQSGGKSDRKVLMIVIRLGCVSVALITAFLLATNPPPRFSKLKFRFNVSFVGFTLDSTLIP